eukprot:scaffold34567_cov66-Cyclotella_meneghiniana.AAC.3
MPPNKRKATSDACDETPSKKSNAWARAAAANEQSQQTNNPGSIRRLELEAGRLNPRRSTPSISHNSSDDSDRKMPAMKPRFTNESSNKDNRFLCSICLETVSDEPVVTRCGHLYCWTCLYPWLEPGMLLSEYTAAFGAPRGAATASRGGRAGLNFLNEMTYSNVNANHRPYNPSGGRYNENRRRCPVCKADCTVDSVLPVYIHHSTATRESFGDESTGLGCMNECSNGGSAGSASLEVAAAAREAIDLPERGATYPQESPTLDDVCSSFDTEPTSNVGLRQRWRASPRQQNSPRQLSTMTTEPIFDSLRQFADNRASNRTNRTNNDSPIHPNGSQANEREYEIEQNATAPSVPSPPVPTSPWVTNRTLHPTTPPASAPQQSTETNDTVMRTSSPFRLALQPRRQPLLSASPPRAYHTGTQHRGGLTSVLMGLVNTIDNLAAEDLLFMSACFVLEEFRLYLNLRYHAVVQGWPKVEKLSLSLLLATSKEERTLPDLLSNVTFHTHCTKLSSWTKLQMTHDSCLVDKRDNSRTRQERIAIAIAKKTLSNLPAITSNSKTFEPFSKSSIMSISVQKKRHRTIILAFGCPVLWRSKLQTEIVLSTMEAEYVGLSTACKDLLPIMALVHELRRSVCLSDEFDANLHCKIHEDNVGALTFANLEPRCMTPRSKHYSIKYHWFREHVHNKSNRIDIVKLNLRINLVICSPKV